MQRLLEGVRVLDLTQAYSGPYACMHLADQGAEVIKVEPIHGDQTRAWPPFKNGYSGYYSYINRNKKGIALDLKKEEGKEALRQLIAKSDVIVENFKAGTFAKLGFTFESMKEINPGIIYAQITGFGLNGPLHERPCYDIVAQAESGLMDMTGFPDGDPVKVGPSIADAFTGTYLSLGIMMALYRRGITGEGFHIDVSMLDTMFSAMEAYVVYHTLLGDEPTRAGNVVLDSLPWDLYTAKDGTFVLGAGTQRHWEKFCEVLGLDDLIEQEEYKDFEARGKHYYGDLLDKIEEKTRERTLEDLEEKFVEAGVPFGRVRALSDTIHSEQIKARNMLWEIYDPGLDTDLIMPGTPIKIEGVPDEVQCAAPVLGQDDDSVLKELLGYSESQVKKLREEGVIL